MAEGGRGGNPLPVAAALAPGTADSMSESASSQRRASFGRACWCGSPFGWTWAPRLSRVFGLKWLWSGAGRRGARVCTPGAEWGGGEEGVVVWCAGQRGQRTGCPVHVHVSLSLSVCLSPAACLQTSSRAFPMLSGATISVVLPFPLCYTASDLRPAETTRRT